MTQQTLRLLIVGLLMLDGVFHLALALIGAEPELGWGMAAGGFVYIALAFFVRRDVHKKAKKKTTGRTAIIFTVCITTAALVAGAAQYLSAGGPLAFPFLLLLDLGIVAAGIAWLMKLRKKA